MPRLDQRVVLKFCPFCGDANPSLVESPLDFSTRPPAHFVQCNVCHAVGPVAGSAFDAVALWNRRATFMPSDLQHEDDAFDAQLHPPIEPFAVPPDEEI